LPRTTFNDDIEQEIAHEDFRVRQNVYFGRSVSYLTAKTLKELHEALNNYNLIIYCGKSFKFINDREKNIVIFTCLH